ALVLLVGPAGSGKSTFARAHFGPTQVVSSDFCRALVADEEDDQSASPAAFEVLYLVVRHRLRRRRLTVVDATNVDPVQRRQLLRLARAPGTPVVAVVFDLPEEVCVERDGGRPGRSVGPAVIHAQRERMLRWLPAMDLEGFTAVYRLGSAVELDCATVVARGAPSPQPSLRRGVGGLSEEEGDP
ncbi:MAG: AAA family ATPase, partial [Candidatus Dormibacteraeota bacterium]|nr:AAA family ATPase [Candidatus Dormibacteraeota bacterium]